MSSEASPAESSNPLRAIGSALDENDRRIVRWCLSLMGVLAAISMLGAAMSMYLVNETPLLLMAMSPAGQHFLLAAPQVALVPFVVVGTVRRVVFYLASFYLGRVLGQPGLTWLARQAPGMSRIVRWVERMFNKAPRLCVFFLPGPSMCAVAGIAGMSPTVFTLLSGGGMAARLVLMWYFAEVVREPLEVALEWIKAHRFEGTLLIVAGIAIYQFLKQRRRRRELAAEAEALDT